MEDLSLKKSFLRLFLLLLIVFCLSGCSKKEDLEENETLKEEDTDKESKKKKDKKKEDKKEVPEKVTRAVDITSEEEVMSFIAGEWRLIDTLNDSEFATLTIDENGSCSYSRDFDELGASGTFKVSKHQRYDAAKDELIDDEWYTDFELSFEDLDEEFNLPDSPYIAPDKEKSTGNFYISESVGYDYLYLTWVGNGDSYIFENVFQNIKRIATQYMHGSEYDTQQYWVFRRSNEVTENAERPQDTVFYGLVWQADGSKLLVQPMDPHAAEAYEDFSDRRFISAYFTPSQTGLAQYELTDSIEIDSMLYESRFLSSYPIVMCYFMTDKSGNVTMMSEVDRSYYGIYDLGSCEPEFTYEGLTFTINSFDYSVSDYAPAANAIMDMYKVGDFIVVDTHVNPHIGIYILFNTVTGNVEKTIAGTNLTWVNDDIETAVYSSYDQVFNFKDHLIGSTDGDEVYEIKYDEYSQMITVKDMNDHTYEFETDLSDSAIYSYAQFRRSNRAPSKWNKFIRQAPDDAIAFVMINPPQLVSDYLPMGEEIDNEALDTVYVVALKDDTLIELYDGSYNFDNNGFDKDKLLNSYKADIKGTVISYKITVPEGMPNRCIYITTADNKTGSYQVLPVSGMSDACGYFILAD